MLLLRSHLQGRANVSILVCLAALPEECCSPAFISISPRQHRSLAQPSWRLSQGQADSDAGAPLAGRQRFRLDAPPPSVPPLLLLAVSPTVGSAFTCSHYAALAGCL